jgi:tetratricopeptide (TPR) repeat protein
MEELTNEIHNQIIKISEEANSFFEKKDYRVAIEKYKEALNLLPNPKYEWDSFSWLHNNIGNSYIELCEWELAFNHLHNSLLTPQGMQDSLIWFYAAKALFEMNIIEKSETYFVRSYTLDSEIFQGENIKYKNLALNKINKLNQL